jgi:hypothetical protein
MRKYKLPPLCAGLKEPVDKLYAKGIPSFLFIAKGGGEQLTFA